LRPILKKQREGDEKIRPRNPKGPFPITGSNPRGDRLSEYETKGTKGLLE
jgi:hypothetical protein